MSERSGCPCTLVEPCMSACSCASPGMSGGCRRCASFGNMEQRIHAAEWLVKNEKDLKKFRDEKWLNDYLGSKGVS